MSYWSLLDDARRELASGSLLAAERLLAQARREHSGSRLRAPLSEKAVEPMVRWARRVLQQPDAEPAGPAFPARAAQLESDWEQAIQLRLQEAVNRLSGHWEALTREELARLTQLLLLHRHSDAFRLSAALVWPLARTYLHGCGRHLLPADPELLVDVTPSETADLEWLSVWGRARVAENAPELGAFSPWLIQRLTEPGLPIGHPARPTALGLCARLSLLDPMGAPAALALGRAALLDAAPGDESRALLRWVAGLTCNEARLAVPAAFERRLLELAPVAARLQLPWPPGDLAALLRSRRPPLKRRRVAALAWEEGDDPADPGRLALLRLADAAPCDALLLARARRFTAAEHPFALPPVAARAEVDAWLELDAVVLCEEEPPDDVLALLGERPVVALAGLEQALGLTSLAAPLAAAAAHPAFSADDALAARWSGLVENARAFGARLTRLAELPALGSPWGLRNLETLGNAGLAPLGGLCAALRSIAAPAESPAATDGDGLQRVPLSVPLLWPRLAWRRWPARTSAPPPTVHSGGDLLLMGVLSPAELAALAAARAPCTLLAADSERGKAIAASVAAMLSPRAVTLAPEQLCCAEPLLALLDRWIQEAVAEPVRCRGVVGLYHALASNPDGDVARWLSVAGAPQGGSEELETLGGGALGLALSAGARGCGDACRLHDAGGCFTEQLGERAARGSVWIDVGAPGERAPAARALVVDDLTRWVAVGTDAQATAAWDRLAAALRSAPSLALSADLPVAGELLAERLAVELPPGRAPRPLQLSSARTVGLSVCPPGYEPGSLLLHEEALALSRLRAAAWVGRGRQTSLWLPAGTGEESRFAPLVRDDILRGASTRRTADVVVVPLLGAAGALPDVIALLRLAMAATHAQRFVVCVDPRLAAIAGRASAQLVPDPALPDPLAAAAGAHLLDQALARKLPRWRAPLDRERLAAVWALLADAEHEAPQRLGDLAHAVHELARGGRLALGGTDDAERVLLCALLGRLARESGDGGPLSVRCVVWLHDEAPPLPKRCGLLARHLAAAALPPLAPAGALEQALLDAETGSVQVLGLPPSALELPTVRAWAARATEIAWMIPDADRASPRHPAHDPAQQRALARLGDLPAHGGPLLLCLLDALEETETLRAVAARMGGVPRAVAPAPELERSWRCVRVPLPDPAWRCPACSAMSTVSHPYAACSHCGAGLLRSARDEEVLRTTLLRPMSRWLAQQSSRGTWLALARERPERDALNTLLGVDAAALAATPLLAAPSGLAPIFSIRVLALADLWTEPVPDGELVLVPTPSEPAHVQAVLERLAARGRAGGVVHCLDHPLLWAHDAAAPQAARAVHARAGAWRWTAARAEVEYRLRDGFARLERALESPHAASSDAWDGLGPIASRARGRSLGALAEAAEGWWLAAGSPAQLEQMEPATRQQALALARRRGAALLARMEERGLAFADTDPIHLDLTALEASPAAAQAALACARWLRDEGLLQAVADDTTATAPEPDAGEGARAPDAERWLAALRTSPAGQPSPLPDWPAVSAPQSGAGAAERPAPAPATGAWILGVPGSGKTTALLEIARCASDSDALLLVPGSLALLRADACARASLPSAQSLELATSEELALSFLRRDVATSGEGPRPRLLPPVGAPDGDAIRRRLIADACRRYAQAAGRAPALDVVELRHVVEGRSILLAAAAAEGAPAVDLPLLMQCAAQARGAAGWVPRAELCAMARHRIEEHGEIAAGWRDRYPLVLLDDAHAFDEQELSVIDEIFPEAGRHSAADPALLPPQHPQRRGRSQPLSYRLSRELARAAAALLVRELHAGNAVQTQRRVRGRLDRRRGIHLNACVDIIGETLAQPGAATLRNGILVGGEEDRSALAAALRERGVSVWEANEVGRSAAPGPRELLGALLLCDDERGLAPAVRGRLAAVLVRSAGETPAELEPDGLGARLAAHERLESAAVGSRADALLQALTECGRRVRGTTTLSDAAAVLRQGRVLPGVDRSGAARGRLELYLESLGARAWRACARAMDPQALCDPLGAGRHVWLVTAAELAGAEFDHLIYLCTGHEAFDAHYRALGRSCDLLTVIYSDVDPFAGLL